jgi:hypothetical protein
LKFNEYGLVVEKPPNMLTASTSDEPVNVILKFGFGSLYEDPFGAVTPKEK